jgi:hypothetical protein
MPEPIQSSSSSPSANTSYDPSSDDVGRVCRADAPSSSTAESSAPSSPAEPHSSPEPAVAKLVSSVPRPPAELPPTGASPPASTANNNAQRTSERSVAAHYADAGVTASGDSVFAGLALVKGPSSKGGAEVEVLSVSAQVGAQTELQFGLERVAGTRGVLSGSVEAFTARAHIGIHNDDGSTGLNVGAGVTAVGFEGTVGGASRLTYGVAAGVGASLSVGAADVDRDGSSELCARVSLGPVTVGACLENPL